METKLSTTFRFDKDSGSIPNYQQRQDSTDAQLRDLYAVANRLGLYDAADILRNLLNKQ